MGGRFLALAVHDAQGCPQEHELIVEARKVERLDQRQVFGHPVHLGRRGSQHRRRQPQPRTGEQRFSPRQRLATHQGVEEAVDVVHGAPTGLHVLGVEIVSRLHQQQRSCDRLARDLLGCALGCFQGCEAVGRSLAAQCMGAREQTQACGGNRIAALVRFAQPGIDGSPVRLVAQQQGDVAKRSPCQARLVHAPPALVAEQFLRALKARSGFREAPVFVGAQPARQGDDRERLGFSDGPRQGFGRVDGVAAGQVLQATDGHVAVDVEQAQRAHDRKGLAHLQGLLGVARGKVGGLVGAVDRQSVDDAVQGGEHGQVALGRDRAVLRVACEPAFAQGVHPHGCMSDALLRVVEQRDVHM